MRAHNISFFFVDVRMSRIKTHKVKNNKNIYLFVLNDLAKFRDWIERQL